jgi:diguanylate cyclase (GGDEF)-like protein
VEVADKLRRLLESHPFRHRAVQPEGRVTLSVGVASFPDDATEQLDLVDCADAALYASKSGGRNRITAFARGMERDPGRERGPYARARILTGSGP